MKHKVFRDSVYGDIYITKQVILDLINAPEFQRLRRIIQLGGSQYVFTGATHTRFSHGIGAYNVVSMFLKNDSLKSISDDEATEVQIASLIHDIGHGPFSHAWEKVNHRSHELYTLDIIKSPNTTINKILKANKINVQHVCQIIEGKHPNKILNSLVSSQLDSDRLDYLARDAMHTNVNYASLDVRWIVRHAEAADDKIVYPEKLVPAIEAYLLGRYHMYKQIYDHKISIAFDGILVKTIKRIIDLANSGYEFKNYRIKELLGDLIKKQAISLASTLELDDYTFIEMIKTCMGETDAILRDLSSRLINRNFYKGIATDKPTALATLKKLGLDPEYYLVEKSSHNVNLYKHYNKKLDHKDETIYIKFSDGSIKPLETISRIIKQLTDEQPKDEQTYYIFAQK